MRAFAPRRTVATLLNSGVPSFTTRNATVKVGLGRALLQAAGNGLLTTNVTGTAAVFFTNY